MSNTEVIVRIPLYEWVSNDVKQPFEQATKYPDLKIMRTTRKSMSRQEVILSLLSSDQLFHTILERPWPTLLNRIFPQQSTHIQG